GAAGGVEGAAHARPRSRDGRGGSTAALDSSPQRTHAAARSGRALELPRGTAQASAPRGGADRVRGAPATPRGSSNRALLGAFSRSLWHVRAQGVFARDRGARAPARGGDPRRATRTPGGSCPRFARDLGWRPRQRRRRLAGASSGRPCVADPLAHGREERGALRTAPARGGRATSPAGT